MEMTSGLGYSEMCQFFLLTPQHLEENWHKKFYRLKKTLITISVFQRENG